MEDNRCTCFVGTLPPSCDQMLEEEFVDMLTMFVCSSSESFVQSVMDHNEMFPGDTYTLQLDGGEVVEE